MTTEAAPCVHTARQQETRIVEAVAEMTGRQRSHVPFYAIQARTGIAVMDLYRLLDGLVEAGRLARDDGSYRLPGACPHTEDFQTMRLTACAWCGEIWP